MDRVYEPRRRSSGVDADPASAPAAAVGDGDGVSAIARFLSLSLLPSCSLLLLAGSLLLSSLVAASVSMAALVFRETGGGRSVDQCMPIDACAW